MAEPEVHIASFIVHFHETHRPALEQFLGTRHDLEIMPVEPPASGRLVVVCEASHQGDILDRMDLIERVPGVLGCSMVYHEVMTDREAEQQLISKTTTQQ